MADCTHKWNRFSPKIVEQSTDNCDYPYRLEIQQTYVCEKCFMREDITLDEYSFETQEEMIDEVDILKEEYGNVFAKPNFITEQQIQDFIHGFVAQTDSKDENESEKEEDNVEYLSHYE